LPRRSLPEDDVPKLLHHPASGGFTAASPSSETRPDGLRPAEDLGARAAIGARLFGEHATPVMIGRFRVTRRIGAGAMGRVYEAIDEELDRRVALKLLGEPDLDATGPRLRMLREARSLARLSHDNVVQIFDVGEHDGSIFLAMEYVDGPSLLQWQAGGHRWRSVLDKYMQAGRGLVAVHETGVVHRDFKPANVLLDLDGRVKLADFGVAIVESAASTIPDGVIDCDATTAGGSRLTQTGAALGTPAYMSPEQLRAREVDARSDQFSFCVALYEAVYRQLPYTVEQRRDPDGRVVPGVRQGPGWLRQVLLRGLAIRPEDRWRDMGQLLRALRRGADRRRTLAIGGGVVSCAAAIALGSAYAVTPSCAETADDIDEVWGRGRSEDVRAAFERSGVPYARATTDTVLASLDGYAQQWSTTRIEACRDHRIDGVRSADFYDASMACLDRRLVGLDTLVTRFTEIDGEGIASAGELLSTLQPLAACVDADALRSAGRNQQPSESAGLDQLVLEARLELALGHHAEALARGDAASERARGLAADRVRAEAEAVRGHALRELERWPEAQSAYLDAIRLAEGTHHDELTVELWRGLIMLDVYHRENAELGATWLVLLDGAVRRLGDPPRARAEYLIAEGRLAALREDSAAAEQSFRAALEQLDATTFIDSADTLEATRELANSLAQQGRLSAAEELYERAMRATRERWGDDHPEIAALEFDLGLLAYERREFPRTLVHVQRALVIESQVYGEHSVRVAATLTVIAAVEHELGLLEAARLHAERAWEIQRDLPPGHSERDSALAEMINLATDSLRYRDALELALRLVERSPADPAQLALTEHKVAWMLCALERCKGAEEHLDRAERAAPADHPVRELINATRLRNRVALQH
jgi:eukaryotic-like serine/threonine-protein kinase